MPSNEKFDKIFEFINEVNSAFDQDTAIHSVFQKYIAWEMQVNPQPTLASFFGGEDPVEPLNYTVPSLILEEIVGIFDDISQLTARAFNLKVNMQMINDAIAGGDMRVSDDSLAQAQGPHQSANDEPTPDDILDSAR